MPNIRTSSVGQRGRSVMSARISRERGRRRKTREGNSTAKRDGGKGRRCNWVDQPGR